MKEFVKNYFKANPKFIKANSIVGKIIFMTLNYFQIKVLMKIKNQILLQCSPSLNAESATENLERL